VQKGEDPMQVLMEIGPRIGGQGAVEAAVVRAQQAQQAAQLKAQTALAQRVIQPPQPFDQGGMRGFMTTNRWGETVPHFAPRAPTPAKVTWPREDTIRLQEAMSEVRAIRSRMIDPKYDDPGAKSQLQQQLRDQQDTINSLYEKHPESKLPKKPLPLPASRDPKDMIEGQTYLTKKGVMVWDGKHLVSQQSPAASTEEPPTDEESANEE
jgi:hypothetical protein